MSGPIKVTNMWFNVPNELHLEFSDSSELVLPVEQYNAIVDRVHGGTVVPFLESRRNKSARDLRYLQFAGCKLRRPLSEERNGFYL